jgi:hypothetical protein
MDLYFFINKMLITIMKQKIIIINDQHFTFIMKEI